MTMAMTKHNSAPTAAVSEGVAIPPYIAYSTPTIIARNGKTRGKISNFSAHVYDPDDNVAASPDFQVEYSDHIINNATNSNPGITPARNSRPIEVSVAIP